MKFYRIELARKNQGNVVLGTVPSMEDVDLWMSGAYANGLLPDPPLYTDQIQVFEVLPTGPPLSEEKATLVYVWVLTWHMFEARKVN